MGGVVTFLKKAGTLLVNAVSVVELGYPILGRLIPKAGQGIAATIVNDLEQFSGVVTTIEQIGASIPAGLTGEQKLAAALPAITQAVAASSVMAGKKIANQALFQKACSEYAQATVDMLNSLDPSSVVAK
jgi:hypothetical protein